MLCMSPSLITRISRETVLNFEQWNHWFEQYPDLILKGQWASDIDRARETDRTAIFLWLSKSQSDRN